MPDPPHVVNVASNPSENREDLQHGGAVVHFGNVTNNMENTDNAEKDCVKDSCMKELPGETQVALDHEIGANMSPGESNLNQHGGEGIVDARTKADQRDINSEILKNEKAKKRTITRAELLQHSGKKQKDAAAHFGGEARRTMDYEKGANVPLDGSNQNEHGEEVLDIVDSRSEAEQRDTNSDILENERAKKRIHRDYRITLADPLQHSEKKLMDAAAHFGVRRSTFKRLWIDRKFFSWPPRKAKHDDGPSDTSRVFVQPAQEELQLPVHPVQPDLDSKLDSTQDATSTVQNDSSMLVKVTYREDTVIFNLSVSSGKRALEEEIAKRFPLSIGSFSVKYLDEDGDWILVSCDADLETCISIMRSSGKNTVKMSIQLPQHRN